VDQRSKGEPAERVRSEVRAFLDRIHRVFNVIDMAPLTTIAALHGFCFGGGFELALTCDILIADKSTRFCFPELRLGVIPGFGGISRLRREVSNGVMRDLLLTGRSINVERAHALGLVSQVVGRGEALHVARLVAEQHAKLDPHAAQVAKRLIKSSLDAELEEEKSAFVDLITSPRVESALRQFVESSDPFRYLG
jgi:enoyl-CoA hydratase/carnithine racemase